jgi:hypothetical protein
MKGADRSVFHFSVRTVIENIIFIGISNTNSRRHPSVNFHHQLEKQRTEVNRLNARPGKCKYSGMNTKVKV